MEISFILNRQIITRTDRNRVVAGSRNYLTARFVPMSPDWEAPITVIFGNYTQVLDDDFRCYVPWEVLEPGSFQVSAFCGDLHTANTATVHVEESGYKDGETPAPPTPDVYSHLTTIVEEAKMVAQSVRDDADAGRFDGEDGKRGFQGVSITDVRMVDATKIQVTQHDPVTNLDSTYVAGDLADPIDNAVSMHVDSRVIVIDKSDYDALTEYQVGVVYLVRQ